MYIYIHTCSRSSTSYFSASSTDPFKGRGEDSFLRGSPIFSQKVAKRPPCSRGTFSFPRRLSLSGQFRADSRPGREPEREHVRPLEYLNKNMAAFYISFPIMNCLFMALQSDPAIFLRLPFPWEDPFHRCIQNIRIFSVRTWCVCVWVIRATELMLFKWGDVTEMQHGPHEQPSF